MAQPPQNSTEGTDLPLEAVDRSIDEDDREFSNIWAKVRSFRIIPILMLCVAFGGIMGLYFQPPGLQLAMRTLDLEPGAGTSSPIAVPLNHTVIAEIDPSATPGPNTVIGLGALLPDGDVTTIAPPFGSGDARVTTLIVDEGDQVTVGDTLAILDNEAQYKAALEAAEANVALRQANLDQTRTSIEASLKEARANLGSAEAAALSARKDYERAQSLIERGTISEAVLDQRQASSDQAARAVDQARATLSRYDVGDIDTQVDVVVAARNYDAAKAALIQAQRDLEKTYVRAPITGTVLKIHVRPGEKPGGEGVMNIGNIERMTAEVEIYQTQIGNIELGDTVDITANALPTALKGTVSHIGLEVERQTLIDDDPAANTDARIVEVTVLLDDASSKIAARYTNLQVVATIQTANGS
ncbi:MAG: HlyD family efflux transporter periplasmic adaptor subunit [Rhodobiaceae bacterium]|nr:HlyD family efflux transporter periplasmic adaptor subunit [Rhodobiaceae bacterium]